MALISFAVFIVKIHLPFHKHPIISGLLSCKRFNMILATAIAISVIFVVFFIQKFTRSRRARTLLHGKHVWVIGASQGLGNAISNTLASSHKATVSVSSRRLEPLTELEKALGPHVGVVVPLDIQADIKILNEAVNVVRHCGPIDVVVLNAGINHANKRFVDVDTETIDTVINTNFRATVQLASLTLPMLRETGGVLCVISSLTAYRGLPGTSIYGATKAALTSFCQSLNVELHDEPVDVVCVHPGFIDTPAISLLEHPKPFIVSENHAAELVIRAIESRRHHIGFPWIMEHIVMTFARLVPAPLYDFILKNAT